MNKSACHGHAGTTGSTYSAFQKGITVLININARSKRTISQKKLVICKEQSKGMQAVCIQISGMVDIADMTTMVTRGFINEIDELCKQNFATDSTKIQK